MDSKNIHIACYHMKGKILWDRSSGNEWSFVGEGQDFKEHEVNNSISSFFNENDIYLVVDRHNSFLIRRDEAAKAVRSLLSDQNITLCNQSFSRMIEFHYIGVAKHGAIHS